MVHNQYRTNVHNLSDRQKEVLEFIISYLERNGYPPSIREIGKALNINSTSSVLLHLKALESKGYVKRDKKLQRSIKVLQHADQSKVSIRILGEIRAGKPIFAQETYDEVIEIEQQKVPRGKDLYALKVAGDSMMQEDIMDGDIAVISKQSTAENGDVVVAILGEDATLKKFHKLDSYIALLPANPAYEPIIVKENQELIIQGKLVASLSPKDVLVKEPH